VIHKHYNPAGIEAPDSYWNASDGEIIRVTGGCGAGKYGDMIIPDTMYGLSMTLICRIHDWEYHHGKTEDDKTMADKRFLANMIAWIDYRSANFFMRWLRHRRALKYYEAVRMFGGDYFNTA